MRFKEYIINEGGYSRLMQIMSGLVPSVKTFAILTWENPMGRKNSASFNKKANEKLKDLLNKGHFSYKLIKGRYNDFENPFVIFNITLNQAKNLGFEYDEYKQDSILFGEKRDKKEDGVGINIKMIYHDNRTPLVRKIWKSLDKDTDDFYSEYKGRKFEIPFFDINTDKMKFKNGKITEYNIFYAKDFDEESITILNEMRDVLLDNNKSGRFLYEHRGQLKLELLKRGKRI